MRVAWRLARLSHLRFATLGVFFPALLALAMVALGYASNRIEWAAHDFGKYEPPAFFPHGLRLDPWLLLLFLAAFAEEFVFRGILQRRLIERYGLYRGLVLVGVIWGAFHFSTDRYSGLSDVGILQGLLSRLAICVAMGFVLSWLTLSSGSILPATLAHGLSNIFLYAGLSNDLPFAEFVQIGAWTLLAYLLFRYWPPQAEADVGVLVTHAAVEPAISGGDAI